MSAAAAGAQPVGAKTRIVRIHVTEAKNLLLSCNLHACGLHVFL
jgi:hypothetical protein